MLCVYANGFAHTKEQASEINGIIVGVAAWFDEIIEKIGTSVKVVGQFITDNANTLMSWLDRGIVIDEPKCYVRDHYVKPMRSQVMDRRPMIRVRDRL